jgi:hypothetical protein
MTKYTPAQLDTIARYWNCFVRQDEDGNVVGNSTPDAETGWRPIFADRCQQALAAPPHTTP